MLWNTIFGYVTLSSYNYLSGVYDLLMDDAENEKWIQYLIELLENKNVFPPSRILETACGTGRITLPLARHGYDLIAIDQSEEMLGIAQQKTMKAGLSTRFVSGDMMSFRLAKPVDAIVCACDGVNYLVRDSDPAKFFTTCWHNLKLGGVLMFDISSYSKITKTLGNNLYYDDREDVTCLWQNKLTGELLHMELTLFIREDNLYRRMDEEHIQRAYKINRIKQMLRDAGFGRMKSFEFFTKNTAVEENERIQFLAVKE